MAAITGAALAAYGPSFSGVFVFDDEPSILRNQTIRHLWPFWRALWPPPDATVSGRPVANLSLALNDAISGTHVWSYHAANLLIHILAGLTLFGVVRRTLGLQPWPAGGSGERRAPGAARPAANATLLALATALLWTLHPLQTEAVTYVVQRVESLMGLFYLLTFYCFIRAAAGSSAPGASGSVPRGAVRTSFWWGGGSVLACLLGVGTKEVTATAPVLLLLYDRTFLAGGFRRAWAERRGLHLALAGTWLPLAALVANTGWNRGGTAGFDVGVSPAAYWLTQFEAIVRYLGLAVWPHPQVFDYGTFWYHSIAAVWWQALVVLTLLLATVVGLVKKPAAGFLGAWFFGILAVTSVVPGTIQMIVEHRMYLPLAALVVGVGCIVHQWSGRRGLVVLVALAAGLGWLTAQRNGIYRSERAIWTDTVAKRPGSDRAQNNLGNVLAKAGELPGAITHFRAAVQLRPDNAETHYNLGLALRRTGQAREAIAQYEQALRTNPKMADAQNALGVALEDVGRTDEAIAHYERALRLDPDFADAHNNLGLALAQAGRVPEAIAHYHQALKTDPANADAHNNLGNALRASGQVREAIAQFEEALRLKPDFPAAHNNLGNALRETGQLPEAIAQYEQSVKLDPAVPEVRNNLGVSLLMAGRAPDAIAQFEAALRLNPDLGQVHLNLAIALASIGREDEAAAQFEAARRLGARLPPGMPDGQP